METDGWRQHISILEFNTRKVPIRQPVISTRYALGTMCTAGVHSILMKDLVDRLELLLFVSRS